MARHGEAWRDMAGQPEHICRLTEAGRGGLTAGRRLADGGLTAGRGRAEAGGRPELDLGGAGGACWGAHSIG